MDTRPFPHPHDPSPRRYGLRISIAVIRNGQRKFAREGDRWRLRGGYDTGWLLDLNVSERKGQFVDRRHPSVWLETTLKGGRTRRRLIDTE